MLELDHIVGGFRAPVFDAQAVFRAVMDAMARPGTIQPVAFLAQPPLPLLPTAAAVALTLCDHDTPIWLDPPLRRAAAAMDWLTFHTSAPFAHTPADAHFALVADPENLISLENFAQGTQEYPDRSMTLIVQLSSLTSGGNLVLQGPGIERDATIAPAPLPRHFVEQWKQNHARFPRGVDLVLAAPDAVACLPRTTRISPKP